MTNLWIPDQRTRESTGLSLVGNDKVKVFSHFVRKIICFLLITFSLHLFVSSSFAQEKQFSASYDVLYDVGQDGVTSVSETIKLKNLTDKFFASNFALTIDSTQLIDISASDNQGMLVTQSNQEGNGTKIDVKFGQQIVGKDKEYSFKLNFKSKDFSEKSGKIWQVTVPKISSASDIDNYALSLAVPVSFGDPTTITPDPKSTSESGGKLIMRFTKEQLSTTGILANFGSQQLFDYQLTYHLKNDSLFPAIIKVSLPSDSTHQKVTIDSILPKPENMTVDSDGNNIGFFKVERKGETIVKVLGKSKLNLRPTINNNPLTRDQIVTNTKPDRYWEADNPIIKQKLADIYKKKNPKSNTEKARLINDFVVNTLSYNKDRARKPDFQRQGALTALSNPDQALCSEFTDLFIAFARAAGIPARQLVGYAYTSNETIRPLSLKTSVLHTWPEYYDSDFGWIAIDPTWQSTTGGVDYFSKFDLNHLTLAIHGSSSEIPNTADEVSISFGVEEFKQVMSSQISLNSPTNFFAGFPAQAHLKILNDGNSSIPETKLTISASHIDIPGVREFTVPKLPPQGVFEYTFDLRTKSIWESFSDKILVLYGDKRHEKDVEVKPFFSNKFFAPISLGLFSLMVTFYGLALGFHFNRNGRLVKK